MKKILSIAILVLILFSITLKADNTNRPVGFVEGSEGGTAGLSKINPNIAYDLAFNTILDVLAQRNYEVEVMNESTGYIRTAWYTKNFSNGDIYKTRFSLNFTPDKKQVRIRSEVEFFNSSTGMWEKGVDDDKTKTVKGDIINQIR
ncbi:MAG: hypothetical protein LBQ34_02305 [Alphaproteobacteria bacterium]|jgi:hypothetical protein|nr:hypothetical protein [Alphaproteobacteria bacterium]